MDSWVANVSICRYMVCMCCGVCVVCGGGGGGGVCVCVGGAGVCSYVCDTCIHMQKTETRGVLLYNFVPYSLGTRVFSLKQELQGQ